MDFLLPWHQSSQKTNFPGGTISTPVCQESSQFYPPTPRAFFEGFCSFCSDLIPSLPGSLSVASILSCILQAQGLTSWRPKASFSRSRQTQEGDRMMASFPSRLGKGTRLSALNHGRLWAVAGATPLRGSKTDFWRSLDQPYPVFFLFYLLYSFVKPTNWEFAPLRIHVVDTSCSLAKGLHNWLFPSLSPSPTPEEDRHGNGRIWGQLQPNLNENLVSFWDSIFFEAWTTCRTKAGCEKRSHKLGNLNTRGPRLVWCVFKGLGLPTYF